MPARADDEFAQDDEFLDDEEYGDELPGGGGRGGGGGFAGWAAVTAIPARAVASVAARWRSARAQRPAPAATA